MSRIRTPRDLGAAVRQARRDLRMSQSDLADAAGVSRQWLSTLERGKRTAEIGLVLRVLDTVGLTLVATTRPDPQVTVAGGRQDAKERGRGARVRVDLDEITEDPL